VSPQAYFRSGPGNRNSQTVANSFAVFAQDQIAIGEHFEILAGIRYDRFSLDFTNLLVPNGDFQRTDNLWSPRLGLVYKPVANASLYFSYSKSFLPQSGDQFNSLDATTAALEPESFENIELGGKWDVSPDFNMTLAIYQLDRTNTRAPGATPGEIVLTGRQRSQGLEFSANGNVLDNWELSAGLAVQNAELLDTTIAAPAGRTVPLVPHVQLAGWSRYNISDPVGVGLGVVYQSSSYASISNAVELPAYTRVDAAAFWQIAKGLEVQVNIENLFNIQYFPTSHTDNNISPGLPRTARFTVRTSF
jgi:catecholate siderophore receptor